MSSSLRVVKDLATGKKIITDAQGTALVLNAAGTVLDSSSSPAAPVVTQPAQTVSAAGAITVKEGLVWVTATGSAAVTLAAPTAGDEGKRLIIMCSAVGDIDLDDTNIIDEGGQTATGTDYVFGPHDVLELMATPQGKWHTMFKAGVTFSPP